MLGNMKIGARLFGLVGLIAALMAVYATVTVRSLRDGMEHSRSSLASARLLRQSVDQARTKERWAAAMSPASRWTLPRLTRTRTSSGARRAARSQSTMP